MTNAGQPWLKDVRVLDGARREVIRDPFPKLGIFLLARAWRKLLPAAAH